MSPENELSPQSPIGKAEVTITPEMIAMLKEISDAKKITSALARPLWLAASAIIGVIIGGTVWWSQQNSYANSGSPALKALIKELAAQREADHLADGIRDQKLVEISTKLTTLSEQQGIRISNLENRANK